MFVQRLSDRARRNATLFCLLMTTLFICSNLHAEKLTMTPLVGVTIAQPQPLWLEDGRTWLSGELLLVNASPREIEVGQLDITDDAGTTLESYDTEQLAKRLVDGPKNEGAIKLGPHESGILLIDCELPEGSRVPDHLQCVFQVQMSGKSGDSAETTSEVIVPLVVTQRLPITVAPPLSGDGWCAMGFGPDSYHRTTVMPLNGGYYAAQRYAIDWIQLVPGASGENQNADASASTMKICSGDPKKNESYPQYGQPVFAVADGEVVGVIDRLPDNTPGAFPEGITLEEATGNSVVIRINDGDYAFYGHMKPGSISVKQGDKVQRGQVIGQLGNSGNSDTPHLHFHVSDTPSPLAGSSLPYVFDSFTITGRGPSDDDLQKAIEQTETPLTVKKLPAGPAISGVMPRGGAIVDFGEIGETNNKP